jgi:hypothetical protein
LPGAGATPRLAWPVLSGTTSTGSVDSHTTSCATLPSIDFTHYERARVPSTISPAWWLRRARTRARTQGHPR